MYITLSKKYFSSTIFIERLKKNIQSLESRDITNQKSYKDHLQK